LWLAWANSKGNIVLRSSLGYSNVEPLLIDEVPGPVHWGRVHCLAFSADGSFLAAGCENGAVFVWHLSGEGRTFKRELVFQEREHKGPVNCVAFAPDDNEFLKNGAQRRFVSAGSDRSVRITEIPAPGGQPFGKPEPSPKRWGTPTEYPNYHAAGVRWAGLDPLGRKLATVGADVQLRLVDPSTGKDDLREPIASITAGAFQLKKFEANTGLPLDAYQAIAKENGPVVVYDWKKEKVCEFTGHSADVRRLAFAPRRVGSNRAASVSEDGWVKVWNFGQGHAEETFAVRSRGGFALAPEGNHLAWLGEDGTVMMRDLKSGKETCRYDFETGRFAQPNEERRLEHYHEYVHALVWNRDGSYLITAASLPSQEKSLTFRGELVTWKLSTGEQVKVRTDTESLWTVAASRDGDVVAWAGLSGSVWLGGFAGGVNELRELRGKGENGVQVVALSPDGTHLAACAGRQLIIFKVKSREVARELYSDEEITALAYSPDGKYLAAANKAGKVSLYGADFKKLLVFQAHKAVVNALAFSPKDSRLLATGGAESMIKLWRLASAETGEPRQELVYEREGHANGVLGLAFNPEGDRLASSGVDKTVRLWETATGREALSLPAGTGLRGGLAFSPNGRRLAAATINGPRVWDAPEVPRKGWW
jgi:WD40 repeat protein